VLTALQFIEQVLFTNLHPGVRNPQFVARRNVPDMAQRYQQRLLAIETGTTLIYDAAICTATYEEGGVLFKERIFTLTRMQPPEGRLWGNRETLMFRAPIEAFPRWEPLLRSIHKSMNLSTPWIEHMLRDQMGGRMQSTDRDQIRRLTRKLIMHHEKTRTDIQNVLSKACTD
jgi:hypothetical protein